MGTQLRGGGTLVKGILALGILVIVVLAALPWMAGVRKRQVRNPGALFADAVKLSKELPVGAVPKDKWPEEVRALQPRGVSLYSDHLWIWTDGGGIGRQWGYMVYFDESKVPLTDVSGATTFTPTAHPNIVMFERRS